MNAGGLEGPLFLAGFATFVMLLGVLYVQVFPRLAYHPLLGNQRRTYELGAALFGFAYVVLLVVSSIIGAVYPLLAIVSGVIFLVLGAVVFFAASRGRYFGTVSDYRIIGRTLLITGGAVLAFGVVVALI